MKILYVGELWDGSTCRARMQVLQARWRQIIPFNTTPYLSWGNRILRAVQHQLLVGPSVLRMNRDLLAYAKHQGRMDMVWVDKGRWIFASTLAALKDMGCVLVHYTPDPAFYFHTSRHFEQGLPLYDICVTTKRYELERYRKMGAKQVIFNWQGIDDRFVQCKACGDIDTVNREGAVFIGHMEKHYVRTLRALIESEVPFTIRGPGWNRLRKKQLPSGSCSIAGPVLGDAYPQELAKARIGIGLLSKLCPDSFTTRSFEVPASGAMLLAERTTDHLELFEEGKEAEFFSSEAELVDKAQFYLRNDPARITIARAGRRRTLENYTWDRVLDKTFQAIEI